MLQIRSIVESVLDKKLDSRFAEFEIKLENFVTKNYLEIRLASFEVSIQKYLENAVQKKRLGTLENP